MLNLSSEYRQNLNDSTIIKGSFVEIISTRQSGVVTNGPDKKNRYRVAVGSLEIIVPLADIKLKKQRAKEKTQKTKFRPVRKANQYDFMSIDLHGNTVEQAIEKLEETLNNAVLQGVREIEIVHGLGTGRVKNAVINYLKQQQSFVTFSSHVSNPGVTIARLTGGVV